MIKNKTISIVIPCRDQQPIVNLTIRLLKDQTVKPDHILVLNDFSKKFTIKGDSIVKVYDVNKKKNVGRVATRNYGISKALDLGSDVVIFIDGDSIPEDKNFIKNYLKFDISKDIVVFGTRKHIYPPKNIKEFSFDLKYPKKKVDKLPSDLLTANIGNECKKLDNTDLRTVVRITERYNRLTFDEKAYLITSGMVAWSCNFMITRSAIEKMLKFTEYAHNIKGLFDYKTYKNVWGGEDNAFGLDAHFSGAETYMNDLSKVLHFMHDRVDHPFTHVNLNYLLMLRYKQLMLLKWDNSI